MIPQRAASVHSDLAPMASRAAPDQERAAAVIEVGFGECERVRDAEAGSPDDHSQAAQPAARMTATIVSENSNSNV
jgi:hypothetical protein